VNGFKGGDSFRLRVRIVQTDMQAVPQGTLFELYRKVGGDQQKQQYTSRWLCKLAAAVFQENPQDPGFDWQSRIAEMLNAGPELANHNIQIGVTSTPGGAKQDGSGYYINHNFVS
jgi:hypothetical protein